LIARFAVAKSGWRIVRRALQIALAIRAPRIDLPTITERHDADAEETEGGEDED
jgi:hypothetical protein